MGRLNTTTLLLAIPVLAGTALADDYETAYELRGKGEILPLEAIIEIQRRHRDGRILEVELERKQRRLIYELEILDDRGHVWELRFDAVTGKLLGQERED